MTDRTDTHVPSEDRFREWDAAYVLGALDPLERREFEDHLATCPACSAAVSELAGMPGLLRLVPAADALALLEPGGGEAAAPGAAGAPGSAVAPEAEVVQLARVAHRSRRRFRVMAGLAAAACGVLLAAGGLVVGRALAPPSAVIEAEGTAVVLAPVAGSGVSADLVVRSATWGTRLDWECQYPVEAWPSDWTPSYELVLVHPDGTRTVVATWRGHGGVSRGLSAASSVPATQIEAVEIRLSGSSDPLAAATVPPAA